MRLGLLDHGLLQRDQPPDLLVQEARTSIPILFVVSIVINIGMWFERFVIIVTSLHRDFLPASWGYFSPTIWDVSCLLGSFGLFFTMFCLFVRFVPMVATAEVKTVLPQANPHWQPGPEREIRDRGAPHAATRGSPKPAPERASNAVPPAAPEGAYYGILAEFATPADLYHACERVRDAGFTRWDAHTRSRSTASRQRWARRSPLPWIVLGMGLTGAALGFGLQWWVHAVAYPLVISGKPLLLLARLHSDHLRARSPLRRARRRLRHARPEPAPHAPPSALPIQGLRAGDRRRLLHLDRIVGSRFDPSATAKLLESLGARSVELLEF